MTLRRTSLAVGAAILALAGTSVADSASAGYVNGGYFSTFTSFRSYSLYRAAPQPGRSLPGAISRPSGNTMRAAPYMDPRGMRGMGAPVGGTRGRR
jgi:hypothetical protein